MNKKEFEKQAREIVSRNSDCIKCKKENESCIVSGRIWNQDQRGKSFKTEANGRDWRKTNPLAHYEILFSFWS